MSGETRTWTVVLAGVQLTGPKVVELRLELLATCRRFGVAPSTVTVEEWLYQQATKEQKR